MSGGGGDPFAEEEEHENNERYLITYADMITLLMALFIILFAIGQTDLEKFAQFREGAQSEVGAPPVLDGGGALLSESEALGAVAAPITTGEASGVAGDDEATGIEPLATIEEAGELVEQIEAGLESAGASDISVAVGDRGVVVTLPSDDISFASGSWDLLPEGRAAIRAVVSSVDELTNPIVVEGHTDNVPMRGPLTNWELSTNRASTVVRTMIDLGVAPEILAASGYADSHPIGSNDTAEGRAANRRVEILVVLMEAPLPDQLVVGPAFIDLLAGERIPVSSQARSLEPQG